MSGEIWKTSRLTLDLCWGFCASLTWTRVMRQVNAHQKNPRKDGFKLCRLGLSADFVFFFAGGKIPSDTPLQRENCNKTDEENEELQIRGWFRGIWSKSDLLFEKNKSQSVLKQTAVSNFLFLMPSVKQKRHVGGQAQAWRLGHLCPLQSWWHLGGERCGR